MTQMTPELIKQAEEMPLEDLRALALREAEEAVVNAKDAEPAVDPNAQPRNEKGQFVSVDDGIDKRDEIDNRDEIVIDPVVEAKMDTSDLEEEAAPEKQYVEKKIDLGDGSGVQVFRGVGDNLAEAYESLADKLAKAQTEATRKIRELSRKVKVDEVKTAQQLADEEYVTKQRLQTDPRATIAQIVEEEIARRNVAEAEKLQRSYDVQTNFVNTHPTYEANPENGTKLAKWVQLHGYSEFTDENMEEAFQDLTASGLLKVKSEGAGVATDGSTKDEGGLPEAKVTATAATKSKKSSGVSSRGSRTVVNQPSGPSEDELYGKDANGNWKLSQEKLRELADQETARRAARQQ
jgi:hypothetical protein